MGRRRPRRRFRFLAPSTPGRRVPARRGGIRAPEPPRSGSRGGEVDARKCPMSIRLIARCRRRRGPRNLIGSCGGSSGPSSGFGRVIGRGFRAGGGACGSSAAIMTAAAAVSVVAAAAPLPISAWGLPSPSRIGPMPEAIRLGQHDACFAVEEQYNRQEGLVRGRSDLAPSILSATSNCAPWLMALPIPAGKLRSQYLQYFFERFQDDRVLPCNEFQVDISVLGIAEQQRIVPVLLVHK